MKTNYTALVTLNSNYDNFHELEVQGISKVLLKFSTIAAIFLLDYTLPNTTKFGNALQTKQLYLTLSSTLVNATLESLDDVVLPAAN